MKYLLLTCVGVLVMGFPATLVQAAVLTVDSDFTALTVGDVFTVDVVADTERKLINAVAADIVYPSDILELVAIDDGESVVNLWVDNPSVESTGRIQFAGVTPGGFASAHAHLVQLKFRTLGAGQGNIESQNGELLLHDGSGTRAPLQYQNLHIAVSEGVSDINVQTVDDEAPEDFTPVLMQDPDVYEGEFVLVFTTQDKGSGIEYFAVKEGVYGRFEKAESPYRIRHQSLDVPITVKAVDRAGNERFAVFYPQNWLPWYERSRLFIGILIVCALSLYMLFIVRRRISRR